MKKICFLKFSKPFCLALLAVGTVLTTATTLCSCGGGGDGTSSSFEVTASQFKSGSKSFLILSRATFRISSTGESDVISPDSIDGNKNYAEGTAVISYNGYQAPIYYTYNYDSNAKSGTLYFSLDATKETDGSDKYEVSEGLWYYIVKGYDEPEDAGDDDEEVGTGSGAGMAWNRSHIDFNFTTAQCRLFYDDNTSSQNIDFRVSSESAVSSN